MVRRTPHAAAALLIAFVLVLTGCGDDDDGRSAGTTSAPATGGSSTTAAAGNLIEVEVSGGEPVGGVQDARVDQGDDVTLRVTADVSDEVHVHGYDLKADVAPGQPAELRFTADLDGQFEVELEDAGTQILNLVVG